MNFGNEICYEMVFLSLLHVTAIQLPASFFRGLRGKLSYRMDGWMGGWMDGWIDRRKEKGREGGKEEK